MRMAHDWANACLPELPPRSGGGSGGGGGSKEAVNGGNQDGGGQPALLYANAFTGSELKLVYGHGLLRVESDSVSSLAIVRDVVGSKASSLRVGVASPVTLSKAACVGMLRKVDPKLRYQLDLAARVNLIDAVQEIALAELSAASGASAAAAGGGRRGGHVDAQAAADACPWLAPELKDVLVNAEKLRAECKERPRALQYICGILTDLFVDWHRFRGSGVASDGGDVRHRIPELHRFLIEEYSFEGLLAHFGLQ
jgi:Bardet-Biedl syndrome 7 protein